MNIKIKYLHAKGITRIENSVDIKEVMVNEDLVHPENEKISIGFVNEYSSGLIEFSSGEFDKLVKSAHGRTKLIKGMKVIRG